MTEVENAEKPFLPLCILCKSSLTNSPSHLQVSHRRDDGIHATDHQKDETRVAYRPDSLTKCHDDLVEALEGGKEPDYSRHAQQAQELDIWDILCPRQDAGGPLCTRQPGSFATDN